MIDQERQALTTRLEELAVACVRNGAPNYSIEELRLAVEEGEAAVLAALEDKEQ